MTLTAEPGVAQRAPTVPRIAGNRVRRPPWVVLGVVAVLGGALAGGLVSQSAGERISVLVAARDVAAGQTIEAADLRVVDVAVDGDASVVPASKRADVVGRVASGLIPKGGLIAAGQLTSGSVLAADEVVIGAALGPGELPVANLRAGDRVRLVEVANANDGPDVEPRGVLGEARIFAALPPSQQSGVQFVSLVVNDSLQEDVTNAVAGKRLRLVLIRAGESAGG